jgi:dihydrofolate synthase / dihydropteroate synthase
LIADVAHNEEAMAKLCDSLRRLNFSRINVIFGLMQDKAYKEIISLLQRNTKRAYIVKARTDRSRDANELAKEFKFHNIPAFSFNSVASGLGSALKLRDGTPFLITGSHFVVGEAMAYLKKEKYLTINQ